MTETELWFTRVRLNRQSPDLAPLIATLLPDTGEGEKLNATHKLLWTLMPQVMQQEGKPGRQDGGARAAFLWRADEKANSWYMLGPEPRQPSAFFDVDTKRYDIALTPGDRLAFDLVANATVNRLVEPGKGRDGRKRCDVVMDALKAHERGNERANEQAHGDRGAAGRDRAAQRQTLADAALRGWLGDQGARCGFRLNAFDLVSYRTVEIDRPRNGRNRASRNQAGGGGKTPLMGVGHMRGILTVTDAPAFAAKVETGFGRAKAFGCGLMLLRRVE